MTTTTQTSETGGIALVKISCQLIGDALTADNEIKIKVEEGLPKGARLVYARVDNSCQVLYLYFGHSTFDQNASVKTIEIKCSKLE